MSDYSKPLDKEGWSEHYNSQLLESVIRIINDGDVQVWAQELLDICEQKSNCLEVGCGTGISSLWLAKNGRNVTALDYTDASIELVNYAKDRLGITNLRTIKADATKELPFEEKQFDYIFQAGLLEHFETEEQIRLLRSWARYGRRMISMVPNAASIPYRVGKHIMEENGTWEYGLEIPQHSFREEFLKAGITVEKEYSIGTEWALTFLPKRHYIRKMFLNLQKDGYCLDDYMQGYLLVTIGRCE